MGKIISHRQKLLELAKIYKIDKIFDKSVKLTTYDIEILLLKNNVPLPSNKRGYISHKFINEFLEPFYWIIKKKIFINISGYVKDSFGEIRKKIFIGINRSINFFYENVKKSVFKNFKVRKLTNKIFNGVENYFNFVIFNIVNFFKVLTKTIIDALNDIYNFQIKEKILKNLLSKGIYTSLVLVLIFSGFYIKQIVTDVDSLKISLEIKSDKKNSKKKEVAKTPGNLNKDVSKDKAEVQKSKKPSKIDGEYKLNTQTVLNLFEDLEYDLDHVRSKKKVKPIYFTRLPKDLDTIKSVKEKKETFLQILLPLVVAENEKIKQDRKYLLKLLKGNQTEESKKWLNKKYKSYKVLDRSVDELMKKIDIIPTSIALAQAAKESGWGTSRFALEGNAIYGQWTWNGDGIEPLEKTKDQNHKILKFPLLRASVKAYITNLNTHRGYKSFREKRSELRKKNKQLSGLELIHELKNYAQTGEEYTKILEKIIKQNDLDELEAVIIDDFKDNKQLKL